MNLQYIYQRSIPNTDLVNADISRIHKDNHQMSFSGYLVSQHSIGDLMTGSMRSPLLILGIHTLAQSNLSYFITTEKYQNKSS